MAIEYFSHDGLNRFVGGFDVFVFDMNGLIVDDEPLQLEATNRALEPFGITISEAQWISQCVGRKPREFLPEILGKEVFEKNEDIVARKDEIYKEIVGTRAKDIVREGFLDFLVYLHHERKELAVATSTTRSGVEVILGPEGLNIIGLFKFIVCGDEVHRSKPDPEIYLKVSTHFGAKRKFIVFEDTSIGVISAKRAHMACVAVPNRYTITQDFSQADSVLNGFTKDVKPSGGRFSD